MNELDGEKYRCLNCGHHGPFPVKTKTDGELVYKCPECGRIGLEHRFDPHGIPTAMQLLEAERSDGE